MIPPRISLNPYAIEHSMSASVVGTPGWFSCAHELIRTFSTREATVITSVRGFGCGPPLRAGRSAAGELLERFGASDPRVLLSLEKDHPRGERASTHMLHPASPFEVPGGWICATGMVTGRAVWVPAAMAVLWYLQTTGRRFDDDIDIDATGLASGPSLADVAHHGILEVIERDAVGLWWRCCRGHRLVKPPAEISRAATRAGLAVTAALIESDGIAPVAIACVSRTDGRDATLGSACRIDKLDALCHATAEAFMVRATVNAQLAEDKSSDINVGIDRIVWGWHHGPEILERFHTRSADITPTANRSPVIRARIVFNVEPLCCHLSDIILGNNLARIARVLIPGAFRLEGHFECLAHGGDRLSSHNGRVGGSHPFG